VSAAAERPVPPGAAAAVALLTAMNLLNYVDRWVPSAVKELFRRDLGLSDAQTSLPVTAFLVTYMLASPVFGALADRRSRKGLLAAGVALWSLATAGAAFSQGFWSFLGARTLVGIGEAAYATLAPALIADFYPPERRNRVLTVFYVAIPVGSAIGFAAGGAIGEAFGWRAAFLVCGLPGIAVAALALLVREPPRGYWDSDREAAPPRWTAALRDLWRNREYRITVAGYTAVTFASGAAADWFPAYLKRYRGMDVAAAGEIVGTTAVVGGLIGTALGGYVGDRLAKHTRHPYLALSALSMGGATLFVAGVLAAPTTGAAVACMFAGQVLLWFYNGPVNAVLVNCVPGVLRVRAFALSILCIHILGDAISPPIVGLVSDATGSLIPGVAIIPVATAAGAAVWAWGWRRLPAR